MSRNELICSYIGSICRYMHLQYTLVKWDSQGTERNTLFLKQFLSHLANVSIIQRNFYEFRVEGTDKKCPIWRMSYRHLIGVPLIESALYTNFEPIPCFDYSHLLLLGKLRRMTNRN